MEWPRVDGHTPAPWKIASWSGQHDEQGARIVDASGATVARSWGGLRAMSPTSEWRRYHADAELLTLFGPHLCDVPDCPGPRLVARLEAAEKAIQFIRETNCECLPEYKTSEMTYPPVMCKRCGILSAYESASEPTVKERT